MIIKKIISQLFWTIPLPVRPRVMMWLERDARFGEQLAPGLFHAPYNHGPSPEIGEMERLFQACGYTTPNSRNPGYLLGIR
jgi:hypothetical protein